MLRIAFCLGAGALMLATGLMLMGCNQNEVAKAPAPPPAAAAPPATPGPAPQAAPATAAAPAPSGARAIQTQMAMVGDVEVDLVKANIQEGILTVTLAYRNNGKEKVALKPFALDDVYFISETEKKKYHVLKDSQGAWIAAPVARGKMGTETGFGVDPVPVGPASRAVVWFKFPAPPDSVAVVNLVVPDVAPFEKLPLSR